MNLKKELAFNGLFWKDPIDAFSLERSVKGLMKFGVQSAS